VPKITDRTVAFATPWFDVIAKQVDGNPAPHYTVQPPDYASIVATDVEGRLLMVKQYRPVVEGFTLELPSGLVDPGETPEASIRRELIEETGHEAGAIESLGELLPDVGRLGNRMFCFAASKVRPIVPAPALDDGIELVRLTPDEVLVTLTTLRCNHALNFAVLMLAALRGRFAF
jgi:ADP-ribose pyrophosphatase